MGVGVGVIEGVGVIVGVELAGVAVLDGAVPPPLETADGHSPEVANSSVTQAVFFPSGDTAFPTPTHFTGRPTFEGT